MTKPTAGAARAPKDDSKRLAALRAATSGEKHFLWKGDDADYSTFHGYLSRHYPKTGVCEECGSEAATQHALIHGRAHSRNREDYRELCPRCHVRYDQGGERNPHAKLTEAQVAEIRRRYKPTNGGQGRRGATSSRALGAEYGVGHSTILAIVHGRKWAQSLEAP